MNEAKKELERILTWESRTVLADIYSNARATRMQVQSQGMALRSANFILKGLMVPFVLAEAPPEMKLCPPPSTLFTGRLQTLAQMRKFFFYTVSKKHIFVLHGLGGAGKTQIMCRFVHDSMDDPTNK